jgi:hypothetical protein
MSPGPASRTTSTLYRPPAQRNGAEGLAAGAWGPDGVGNDRRSFNCSVRSYGSLHVAWLRYMRTMPGRHPPGHDSLQLAASLPRPPDD